MMEINKRKKKRIFYLDALRALAIISVIIIHVFTKTKWLCVADYSTIPTLNWFLCDFMGNFFRIGVDIFLMLAGALSLGRDWDIRTFLGKRIPRIALPFLFWSIFICLFLVLLQYLFPAWFPFMDSISIDNIIGLFEKAYTYKYIFSQYWFFWMILGTYLIMPVFNKWLLHSDLKEAEYFLVFWLITCLFDATLNIPFPIKLSYFTSPIGFVVLGYYLRHTKRKIFSNMYFPILLIVLMASLEIILSYMFSTDSSFYLFNRYSILMAFEVMGIFLLFRNLDEGGYFTGKIPNAISSVFKKSAESIAKYSYGIYLIFNAIMAIIWYILIHLNLDHLFKFDSLILFVGTLLLSWLVMALLNRVKYINNIIGAK